MTESPTAATTASRTATLTFFASAAEAPTDRHEWTAGPSGFGPRLLLAWLGSEDPLDGIA